MQHMSYHTTAPAAERSRQQATGIGIRWKEVEAVGQQQKSRQTIYWDSRSPIYSCPCSTHPLDS